MNSSDHRSPNRKSLGAPKDTVNVKWGARHEWDSKESPILSDHHWDLYRAILNEWNGTEDQRWTMQEVMGLIPDAQELGLPKIKNLLFDLNNYPYETWVFGTEKTKEGHATADVTNGELFSLEIESMENEWIAITLSFNVKSTTILKENV